ncbi:MAG TPA: hypothetical protein VF666_11230 [Pyrinomonadaceae bacterium]|jgi:hypothetical protein
MLRTFTHIAILLLVLQACGTVDVSAQGWKEYRGGNYQLRIPADWSCHYDSATRRTLAVSSNRDVFLSVRSAPKNAQQRLPDNPTQLKARIAREYELLNATDGTRYDVTTRNIAVEVVNNLRGVVVELTAIVPANSDDGKLYLKKFAGFALVAETRDAFYFATILCSLGSFTYHSTVMNRIINDLRAVNAEMDESPRANPLDGDWLLAYGEGKYHINLGMRGNSGVMRVGWRDAKGTFFIVEQHVTLETRPDGFMVVGSNPVYVSQHTEAPAYAADTLLFQRQPDGSFGVWVRDGVYVKEWTPVEIRSPRAR